MTTPGGVEFDHYILGAGNGFIEVFVGDGDDLSRCDEADQN